MRKQGVDPGCEEMIQVMKDTTREMHPVLTYISYR